jgi:FemAB-related protein (PEP-CTERM system-associated)
MPGDRPPPARYDPLMGPSPLALRSLSDARDPRWDAYVRGHPDGTFHHLLGWRRVIERAYPHEPHYLYTEREGALTGVLPLFAVRGRLFSRALVSVPVGVSGGVLADDNESALLLRDGARALAERERLEYVEHKSEKARFSDLKTKGDLYVTFRQELFGDRNKQLQAIPRRTRAVFREAERAHLRAEFNRADLEPFYDLYALSLRNLGTPMFPKALFIASLEELKDGCDILSVRQTGRVIGCVMNYYYKSTMLPFFAGSLPEARDVGINNYLYWVMLETGFDRGYRVFDFGRSKVDTGAYHFKKHFGMKETPLEYQYDLVLRSEMPEFNPNNPKYKTAIEVWQRLPVELTKVVGPWISRRLP